VFELDEEQEAIIAANNTGAVMFLMVLIIPHPDLFFDDETPSLTSFVILI
jgi:hypothetical protein